MKKGVWLAGLLALSLLTSAAPVPGSAAAETEPVRMTLNGSPLSFTVEPRLIGSTLMVPLRDLSEALGVRVDWNNDTQTAAASKGDHRIQLTSGSKEAARQGSSVKLDEAPVQIDGKLLVPLRFFSESFDFNVYWDGSNQSVAVIDADKSLPTVGSLERLTELFKEAQDFNVQVIPALQVEAQSDNMIATPAAKSETAAAGPANLTSKVAASAPAYSGTNVQVEGVDEADVIKTDGKYIYQLNRNRIIVAEAYPADTMKVLSTVSFDNQSFYPREMYVDDKHLVVIGEAHEQLNAEPAMPWGSQGKAVLPAPRPGSSTTKTIVYELGDRTSLRPIRETEMEGHYISSRKVGSSIYLVTNLPVYNFHYFLNEQYSATDKERVLNTPSYRDTAAGDHFISIGLEDIRYFPGAPDRSYLLIGGLRLDQPSQKMNVTAYLGSGRNVYASQENLYVTVSEPVKQSAEAEPKVSAPAADRAFPLVKIAPHREWNSVIYKFGLNEGATRYVGRGKVPGQVLNQFSMDEQDGYFRIATTTGQMWRNDEHTSKNNLYVLDEAMNTVGKLEDLAPGEKIYSVRYAGHRAYMVTFRNVDPLFVIDLKDPKLPSVLGKLKIPGYSDYLHPYDENHLIGFGKEVVEVPAKNGQPDGSVAYTQGMKLALFDVSDVANPKELYKETIGDRGTHSELLNNHKALLFNKEKNLLAFPVTVYDIPNKGNMSAEQAMLQHGEFTFQGAYVYRLDVSSGFQLRGKITHIPQEEQLKAGRGWYSSDSNINRLLYIGDTLYSSSLNRLAGHDLTTLKELGAISLTE